MRNVPETHVILVVSFHVFLTKLCYGNYDCLLMKAVQSAVFSAPDSSLSPIGYLFYYDSKPLSTPKQTTNGYYRIQFEHQVGYVKKSPDVLTRVCDGGIPRGDIVTNRTTFASTFSKGTSTLSPSSEKTATFPSTALSTTATPSSTTVTPLSTTATTLSTTKLLTKPVTKMMSTTEKLSTFHYWQTAVHTTPTPITWPRGTYGLMEAAQGCPDDGHVTWSEGWRYQDTEGALIGSGNTYTWGIGNYMKGVFTRNSIKTYFCMKKQHVPNSYDHDWPAGSYCILKYGHCPKGFKSGSIFWDDVVIGNHDDKGGALPEGNFGTETEIFYCCRGDGPVSTGIVLPTTKPFILLRYTETCQVVKGMSAYDIFIYWDDQNLFNSDHSTGMHPYNDGDRKNHKLHFCYYSSLSGTGGEPGLVGR